MDSPVAQPLDGVGCERQAYDAKGNPLPEARPFVMRLFSCPLEGLGTRIRSAA